MKYVLPTPLIVLRRRLVRLASIFLVIAVLSLWLAPASGAHLQAVQMETSSSVPGASTSYNFSFNTVTNGTLGSILFQFCSDDPIQGAPCTAPSSFNVTSANLVSQSGATGFSISSATSGNNLILTRTPQVSLAMPVAYEVSNINNPANVGSYYVRVSTYASSDATGSYTDYGALSFYVDNTSVAVNAQVPPFLTFCVADTIGGLNCSNASGNYINFGYLTVSQTSIGQSQFLIATNAGDGYAVWLSGTTLTSGTKTIANMTSSDVSRPGTAQFGLNLRANITPLVGQDPTGPGVSQPASGYNNPNFYRFVPGDVVTATSAPEDFRKYTVSYIANVPTNQPIGVYASTISYICLANF